MSYNISAHYVAETNTENRLKADAKPSVGILSGRNRPSYQTNDRDAAQGLSHDQKCASLSGKTFFHFPSKEDTHDEYDTSVRRNPDFASRGSRPAPLVWRSEPGGAIPHPPGCPRGPQPTCALGSRAHGDL